MAKKKKKGAADDQLELIGPDGDELMDQLATRIDSAVEMIKGLRSERDELKSELEEAKTRLGELEEGSDRVAELEEVTSRFEEQKSEIRNRIEGLLEKFERIEEG